MKKYNKQKGDHGEDMAARYLQAKGHVILTRNYRKKTGEIDLISQIGETVVFTEVKLRTTEAYGTPAQAVDYRRQQRLAKTALWYLQENDLFNWNARFDVVEILGSLERGYTVNHIENAFLITA
ncbi:YraN family protein [Eubacterium sp. 1001713B170207_170306_E7]|uniref:YraN family protein n=1 Tax=Eubacterium sp. 1001713B170207_170306_E7 TaxID=2787097 RepID=UPI001897F721|nr:YraN family protein [Eubacterium sp. 1001713B170207_170306_E7]